MSKLFDGGLDYNQRSSSHKNKINSAIILAAGRRLDFDMPVAFLEIEGKPLIERTIDILYANDIDNITIVTGYKSEYFDGLAKKNPKIKLLKNKNYRHTGTMKSLASAKEFIDGDFLLLESDIIFEEKAIKKLLQTKMELIRYGQFFLQ